MDNLNLQHLGYYPVDHSPLKPEPGRSMVFPLAGQGFIVKSLDGPQALRTRKPDDVFPLLVTFQDFDGDRTGKLFVHATVFFDLPHVTLWIYQ